MEVSFIFRKRILPVIISLTMLLAVLLTAQTPIAFAASSPTAVSGRTLSKEKAGDTSAWIEIAQYGEYSLIIRQEPLTSNLVAYSSSSYSSSYSSSLVRSQVNSWYRSGLSSTAELRNYAVKSNALSAIGSVSSSYSSGMSIPSGTAASTGDDVAFLLSYGEAMQFCSTQYDTNYYVYSSSTHAYNNFCKLLPAYKNSSITPAFWLRTPGSSSYYAGCVGYKSSGGLLSKLFSCFGCCFQYCSTVKYAHCRPAIWVKCKIFEDKGTVNVKHVDTAGPTLAEYSYTVIAGAYGPYPNTTFSGYEYVGLAPGSAPVSGTVGANQTVNIVHQYSKKITNYKVTYYPNEGSGYVNYYAVNEGATHTVFSQGYTRNNYEFDGWNTSPSGNGTSYANGDTIVVTGNVSLYAQWKPLSYTVTYYPNQGIGAVNTYTGNAGTVHVVASQGYTRDDYTFAGWNTNPAGTGTAYVNGATIILSADVSLYAQWKETKKPEYSIFYLPNGGTGNGVVYSATAGTNHTVFDQGFTRANYTFNGWNTAYDGSGTSYQNGATILVNANIFLYAQWTSQPKPEYSITYNPNGGVGSVQTYTATAYTYHYVIDQGYTRADYVFDSWNTSADGSGIRYTNGNPIYMTADVVLYAQWRPEADNYQVVAYYPNQGEGSLEIEITDNRGRITISDRHFVRSGYAFENWNTMANGSGTTYTVGQAVTLTAPLILYAQWRYVAPTYTVTYEPGTGATGGSSDSNLAQGSSYTIKDDLQAGVTHSNPAAIFQWWNTNPDGGSSGQIYTKEQVITINSDITLYAIWYVDT